MECEPVTQEPGNSTEKLLCSFSPRPPALAFSGGSSHLTHGLGVATNIHIFLAFVPLSTDTGHSGRSPQPQIFIILRTEKDFLESCLVTKFHLNRENPWR